MGNRLWGNDAAAEMGCDIKITARGDDEEEAVKALAEVIGSKFE